MIHALANKDIYALSPTNAVSTSRSASFDWLGADYATLRILASPQGTNAYMAVSVLHADSVPSQATQFATIATDISAQNTNSHETVYHVDLRTAKRYGKVIITPGTNAGDAISTAVLVTLSRMEQAPTGTSGMVNTTNDVVTIVGTPGS